MSVVIGNIEVITGPMKCRKTLDIIVTALEVEIALKRVSAYYPADSNRFGDHSIVTRIKGGAQGDEDRMISYPAEPLSNNLSGFFERLAPDLDVVIFDDAQFFNENIVEVAKQLRRTGIDVFISGLDMDCFQQPFGPMPYLMAVADTVIKKTAVCADCHGPATLTYRVTDSKEQILVGDKEYIPLCHNCWIDRSNDHEKDVLALGYFK